MSVDFYSDYVTPAQAIEQFMFENGEEMTEEEVLHSLTKCPIEDSYVLSEYSETCDGCGAVFPEGREALTTDERGKAYCWHCQFDGHGEFDHSGY